MTKTLIKLKLNNIYKMTKTLPNSAVRIWIPPHIQPVP